MKRKLLLISIWLSSSLLMTSDQSAPLNKAQTVACIENLYKANYDDSESGITSLNVENKVLVIKSSSGNS